MNNWIHTKLGRRISMCAALGACTAALAGGCGDDDGGAVLVPTATPGSTTSATASGTASGSATATATPVAGSSTIVALANAYINSLSTAQRAVTVVANTAANAARWSNLPAVPSGDVGTNRLRNGVSYSTLNATQKAAWLRVVQAALGTEAYNQFSQIRAADTFLGTQNSSYSGDYQYLAFVGTPSTTGGWLLQVGGHHIAHNYYFTGSTLKSTTPYFLAVEPTSFTLNGTSYTPLAAQRNGMFNLINSLTSDQLASARLSSSFSDIFLGPGRDARSLFPTGTTDRGILASNLSAAQQALVRTAITAWVKNSPLASSYQSLYFSEIAQTYVAYSGTTSLANVGDYVRIDGPHVWIELATQPGVVIRNQTHYHTIWRDRVTDYNAAYGF